MARLTSMRNTRGDLSVPRGAPVRGALYDADAFGRFSESLARQLGTGKYLVGQTVIVIFWIILNSLAVVHHWDPYPFILLNLAFSTQAAYAAPLILLAQNRQDERDRPPSSGTARSPPGPRTTPSTSPASLPRSASPWPTWSLTRTSTSRSPASPSSSPTAPSRCFRARLSTKITARSARRPAPGAGARRPSAESAGQSGGRAASCSRSASLRTLPEAVRGNASVISQRIGTL